jgi:hypothetical protein
VYVDAAVILTAPDVKLIDPAGIDSLSVVHLAKSSGFFQDASRVPSSFSRDIRPLLVVISGNAGDGKTAFIQQLEDDEEVRPAIKRLLNGATFHFRGRTFTTNYDGSQDEESKVNDEVLLDFFAPYKGDDDQSWPAKETRIIAINEGRLIDFFSQHEVGFRELANIVRSGFEGAAPQSGVVVVNLNRRAVVADPPEATSTAPISRSSKATT